MSFRQRMLESSRARKTRVVLALDFGGPYGARLEMAGKVLNAVREDIAAVKVNHHLLLPYGLKGMAGVIGACKERGLPLIADLKMNDIEATNLNIVDSLMAFGFDAVIANPFVGREEGLGKPLEKLHSNGCGMLFLVYMSHRGAGEGYGLRLEGGEPMYRGFARRAKAWGADGVVVSAKDPEKLAEVRGIVGEESLIFTPGVGAQGGDASASIKAGADFVLVGRSITEAADPTKAARALKAALP